MDIQLNAIFNICAHVDIPLTAIFNICELMWR